MCTAPLSGRSLVEGRPGGERYERLLVGDPVLRSIARVRGCPDPFVWVAGGGVGLTLPDRTYAAALLWASLQGEPDP